MNSTRYSQFGANIVFFHHHRASIVYREAIGDTLAADLLKWYGKALKDGNETALDQFNAHCDEWREREAALAQ